MNCIAGVIFDLGNTLLHFDVDMREMLLRGAHDLAAYLHEQGVGLDAATFASVYVDNLDAAYEQARQDWIEVTGHQTLRRTLADLGLISNFFDDGWIQRTIDNSSLRPWFWPTLTSAGLRLRKPHPDIFHTVLDEWDVLPQRVVMVGDTPSQDIVGAQSVGMRAVLVTMVKSPHDGNDPSIVPDATIGHLGELPALLTQWNEK
jgi:HAD superfamily hydrolase (TIGR01549 family)